MRFCLGPRCYACSDLLFERLLDLRAKGQSLPEVESLGARPIARRSDLLDFSTMAPGQAAALLGHRRAEAEAGGAFF